MEGTDDEQLEKILPTQSMTEWFRIWKSISFSSLTEENPAPFNIIRLCF